MKKTVILWFIALVIALTIVWYSPLISKILASIFVIALAVFNICFGPVINTIGDNTDEQTTNLENDIDDEY